jgi:hypothetical protein
MFMHLLGFRRRVRATKPVQRRRRLEFDVVEPRELMAMTVPQYPLSARQSAPASLAFVPNGNLWLVEAARRGADGSGANGSESVSDPSPEGRG